MKTLNTLALCFIMAGITMSPTGLAQRSTTQSDADVLSRTIRQKYVEKKEDGLNVIVYLIEGSQKTPIDPGIRAFKKGDEIRIEFRSNFDGYVYFVNIDQEGEKTVIYPSLKLKDTQNLIRAGKFYTLPEKNVFEFSDDRKGIDILQVIMARQQVAFLEDAITNHEGALGKTKLNAASELSGFIGGKITQVLPDKGDNAILSRSIRLAPPKDKDQEGAVVTVSDKQLKPGEAAVFEIRLRRS